MAKILVVDDEFVIEEMLRDLLSDEGHEVLLAINGRQGLEFMAQAWPDELASRGKDQHSSARTRALCASRSV